MDVELIITHYPFTRYIEDDYVHPWFHFDPPITFDTEDAEELINSLIPTELMRISEEFQSLQEQGFNNIEAFFELKIIIDPIKIIETARSLGIKLKPYVNILPCVSPEEFDELNMQAIIMGWERVLNNNNIKC
jgi:hypothetical protein